MRKIRIAFIKFAGLSAGGTERWLQMMAAYLDKERFDVDYYYCDAAPYVGSDYKHADTDPSRVQYMHDHGVNIIKFHVGAKDITVPTHDWIDTDFWDVFSPDNYDIVQTAKAGPAEYPYYLIPLPVVECLTLSAGVDTSPNIVWSTHISVWQWERWIRGGGNSALSSLIPIPAFPPASQENLRDELGIGPYDIVAGFHQRASEEIFSPIPLQAFSSLQRPDRHFIIMGGSEKHREQARKLGIGNVHFLPHASTAENISRFLNTLDIFAHGRADGETFGTVFAEAMFHGKCCLSHASAVANAQVETMGPAGLFVNGLDEYTTALGRLFDDTALREKLSSKARPHAERYYSLESCVDALSAIYDQISGRPIKQDTGKAPPYGITAEGYLKTWNLQGGCPVAPHEHGVDAFAMLLFRDLLRNIRVMLAIGEHSDGYCCAAAHAGSKDLICHAYVGRTGDYDALSHDVRLNNWEDRLVVNNAMFPEGGLEAFAGKLGRGPIDCVVCSAADIAVILRDEEAVLTRHRPVVFFHGDADGSVLSRLESEWYDVFVIHSGGSLVSAEFSPGGQGEAGVYLCLSKQKTPELLPGLEKLSRAYRKRLFWQRCKVNWKDNARTVKKAVKHPTWALRRLAVGLGVSTDESSSFGPAAQDPYASFHAHDAQMRKTDVLQQVRLFYAKVYALNSFDAPSHRHAALLREYPGVRRYAVDIGSGAGWLSARLHYDFETVYSIEPSAAGHALAESLYPVSEYSNIIRIEGFAEAVLPTLQLDAPAFFVTSTVLGHLPDDVVEKICAAVSSTAPAGSLLSFVEWWGEEHHSELWHVRTQEWWSTQLSGWDLVFHGKGLEGFVAVGDGKGIHGVKR